ncbi:MAG: hypothetical protein AABX66_00530 [Nanoarchaeota archaeon]
MFNNRRGSAVGEQIMSIWFVLLLIILVAGFSVGIIMYFGQSYDFRGAEAGILNYKIRQCLFFNNIDFSNSNEFFSVCQLNKIVLEDNFNETKIAIRICDGDCSNGKVVYQLGSDFSSCDFIGKNTKYMQCNHKSVNNGKKVFDVIVGSNHQARKV